MARALVLVAALLSLGSGFKNAARVAAPPHSSRRHPRHHDRTRTRRAVAFVPRGDADVDNFVDADPFELRPLPRLPPRLRVLQRIPVVGRYASYVRELWRADEAHSAHLEVGEVGKTTLRTRVLTGVALGGIFTGWTLAPPGAFALGMFLQAFVAQLEYFRVAIIQGAAPARKIVATASAFLMASACYAPGLHELVLPLAATWMMVWLLLARRDCSTVADISTTLMGLFYTAYLPSWWVRLRCAPGWTAAAGAGFPAALRHRGAQAIWWTCLTIAVSDIGAYFGGKKFGRRSLDALGLGAAAKASPHKTLEGALSGLGAAGLCMALGARTLRWPRWPVAGFAYGALLATVALVGDLTASMLKRDGHVKDFGHLFPGHGGILDRLDGFIFVAPLALSVLPRLVGAGAWVA